MLRRSPLQLALVVFVGCSPGGDGQVVDSADVESALFAIHDSMVAGMIAGTSNTAFMTSNWQGVNLNGTPMSAEGFEGEDRVMIYDSIQIIDRNVRLYDGSAALRWHANFFVRVNGQPSFAEMRILDVYVLESGKWLNDLTQVTPIFGTVGNPPGQGGSTGESGNQ